MSKNNIERGKIKKTTVKQESVFGNFSVHDAVQNQTIETRTTGSIFHQQVQTQTKFCLDQSVSAIIEPQIQTAASPVSGPKKRKKTVAYEGSFGGFSQGNQLKQVKEFADIQIQCKAQHTESGIQTKRALFFQQFTQARADFAEWGQQTQLKQNMQVGIFCAAQMLSQQVQVMRELLDKKISAVVQTIARQTSVLFSLKDSAAQSQAIKRVSRCTAYQLYSFQIQTQTQSFTRWDSTGCEAVPLVVDYAAGCQIQVEVRAVATEAALLRDQSMQYKVPSLSWAVQTEDQPLQFIQTISQQQKPNAVQVRQRIVELPVAVPVLVPRGQFRRRIGTVGTRPRSLTSRVERATMLPILNYEGRIGFDMGYH